jgi:hypothetical protein
MRSVRAGAAASSSTAAVPRPDGPRAARAGPLKSRRSSLPAGVADAPRRCTARKAIRSRGPIMEATRYPHPLALLPADRIAGTAGRAGVDQAASTVKCSADCRCRTRAWATTRAGRTPDSLRIAPAESRRASARCPMTMKAPRATESGSANAGRPAEKPATRPQVAPQAERYTLPSRRIRRCCSRAPAPWCSGAPTRSRPNKT